MGRKEGRQEGRREGEGRKMRRYRKEREGKEKWMN